MGSALDPGEKPGAVQFWLDFRYIEKNITWLPSHPWRPYSQEKSGHREIGERWKLGGGACVQQLWVELR